MLNLTHHTLLDLVVNLIPVGILLFMDALFLVYNPWGWNLWFVFWMHFLTLFPLILLLLLSYVSGRVIQRDEQREPEGSATER